MLIANGILLELGQRECPGGYLAIGPRETVMVVAVSPEEARSASEHLYREVEVHAAVPEDKRSPFTKLFKVLDRDLNKLLGFHKWDSEHVAMSTQFPPGSPWDPSVTDLVLTIDVSVVDARSVSNGACMSRRMELHAADDAPQPNADDIRPSGPLTDHEKRRLADLCSEVLCAIANFSSPSMLDIEALARLAQRMGSTNDA